jgi:energy-coupling factor transporter ATP-binding protein EcfA2
VRLTSLRIEALPGIETPLRLDGLQPGVNVVVGPNASGKSSLVRAVRALLTPEALPGAALHVEARFADDGGTWRASRLGETVRWERDGEPSDAPALPPAAAGGGFFLDLEDLLRFSAADRDLAARLATELAGGIDLPRARRELPSVGPRFGRSQAEADREARRRRAEAQRRRDALREDEARVAQLRHRTDEAEARAADLGPVREAQELLRAREELAALDLRRAAAFPEGMARLHDGSLAAVETVGADLERARAARRAAEDARTAAETEIGASGLGPHRPHASDVAAWQAAAQDLADAEREARRADDAAVEAEARLAELAAAGEELAGGPGGPPGAAAERLAPAALDELDGWAAERDEAERERRALERERARLGPRPAPQDDPEALQRWLEPLAAWRAAPDPRRLLRGRLAWLTGAAALAAAVVAAWRATPGPPAGATLAWLTAAAALALAAFALDASARRGGRGRTHLARAYLDAGGPPPPAWREADVRALERTLARRLADAELALRQGVEHDARSRTLQDAADEQRERRDRADRRLRAGLAERGLGEAWADRPALERLRRLHELRRARADAAATGSRRREAHGRAERVRTGLRSALAALPVALDPDLPASAVQERLRALAERVRRRDEAQAAADGARRDAERAAEEAERLARRHAELLVEAGVAADVTAARERPEPALRELTRRAELRPAWRELGEERTRLVGRVAELEGRLADRPDLRAAVEAGDRADLYARARQAADAGGARDRHRDEVARIEQRLATARRERPLGAARAEARRARDALETAYEEALEAQAVACLLDHVEERHRTVRRPALLRRAERWFARFTHHAFELAFDPGGEDGPRVRARDVAAERTRGLGELSTGTKAQLLLALRLAHALEAERGGRPLPLFLDEALTTSDPDRFAAVVDALSQLVREEGRQVVYLTARLDDAALWRHLAAREGGVPPHVVDLAGRRAEADGAGGAAAYRLDPPASVPAPGDRPPEAYAAALRVPPADPWRIAALHPFHLLRDRLELLERLLRRRVASLAAVEALLADRPHAERVLAEDERALVAARTAAARAWAAAWRVGRGRPLDREALRASGAVSDTFLDEVDALARAQAGDAEALLEGLREGRVKRFRDAARDRLEGWLAEHGHLDRRRRLREGERVVALDRALLQAGGGAVEAATLATWLEGAASGGVGSAPIAEDGPPEADG